jgi:hypothetical protein
MKGLGRLGVGLLLGAGIMACLRVERVPGPEDPSLVGRLDGVVVLRVDHSLVGLFFPGGEERVIRTVPLGWGIDAVSGPDRECRVAYIKATYDGICEVRLVSLIDGREEVLWVEEDGDKYGEVCGQTVALSPDGRYVAWVRDLWHLQKYDPDAYLTIGDVVVMDLNNKEIKPLKVHALADFSKMAWYRDEAGDWLLYMTVAEPTGREGEEDFGSWVKVVRMVRPETGEDRFIHVGGVFALAVDGPEMVVGSWYGKRQWRIDLKTLSSREVTWPGNIYPVGLMAREGIVLYIGQPTQGRKVHWEWGSMFQRWPLYPLKAAVLGTGRFVTLRESTERLHTLAVDFGRCPWRERLRGRKAAE